MKLTHPQLLKKFPAFYGNRIFITTFTRAHHVSILSQINPLPYPPYSTSLRSFHLCLSVQSGLLQYLPTIILYATLLCPVRAIYPAHHVFLDLITQIIFGEECTPWSSSLCSLLHSIVTSSLLGPNIFLSTLFSKAFGLDFSLSVSDQLAAAL